MIIDQQKLALPLTSATISTYRNYLNSSSPTELAELMEKISVKERLLIFEVISPQLATHTFEYLPFLIQKELIALLPSDLAFTVLNDLSPDDRTAFLEELPADILNPLLKVLSPEERSKSLALLGYPANSIGRLMTPDYIAIQMDWNVQQVLDFVRLHGKNSETINVIYGIDEQGKLIDDFKIRDFLLAPTYTLVRQLGDKKFIALSPADDEEAAIAVFRKYNRTALPVIDAHGSLLGIVTVDDILHLADQETTEDIQKIGGTRALEKPYMTMPFFELIRKRITWLIILFVGELFTATAMGYFQDEIAKAVVLSLFLPLIISSGGNAGSQASTIIIRALALGEVKLRDYWRIMKRELMAGLLLGCILGAIGFFRVVLWSLFTPLYGPHWDLVAMTVGCGLVGVVLWGNLMGSMLPFILKRAGADPATSSAPFVATLVDVTGLIIYFSLAILILQGTLL